ncbi:MAG: ATP-binding protein [Clostridia bacterium]|nr:ATP-binding protein [Clostridia bacterium]
MTDDEKRSRFYSNYRDDYEVAVRAERAGNIALAVKQYKLAARSLYEMALLEGGQTRREHETMADGLVDRVRALEGASPAQNMPYAPHQGAPAAGEASTNTRLKSGEGENPFKAAEVPDISFDDIVGMEDVKKLVRTYVIGQMKDPELYKRYGLSGGTGILMFGLPGTGKTTMAKAIAHEINAPFYTILPADIRSKWVGESEQHIKQLFDKAAESKYSVIFFDDFDDLGQERSENNHNNHIIVELLNRIQGFNSGKNTIVILAATNHPEAIDPALMRGGRFTHHVYIPLPGPGVIEQLILKIMNEVPFEEGFDLHEAALLMKGYSTSDVVEAVKLAKMESLQRTTQMRERGEDGISPVTMQDLRDATTRITSSVSEKDVRTLRQYAREHNITLPEDM